MRREALGRRPNEDVAAPVARPGVLPAIGRHRARWI